MAARRGNKAWLRQQLAKHLGWDAETAESVVEALGACADRSEADALVEAYLGGNAAARQAVQQFLGPPASAGVQAYQRDDGLRQLERSMAPGGSSSGGAGPSAAAGGGGVRGGSGGRPAAQQQPQAVELPASAAEQAKVRGPVQRRSCPAGWLSSLQHRSRGLLATLRSAPHAALARSHPPALQPLLNMGRNVAVTVKPARKKGGGAAGGGGGGTQPGGEAGASRQLAKPVVNCLRCGKIYDCRTTSDAARRFLGACVRLERVQRVHRWDACDTMHIAAARLAAQQAGRPPAALAADRTRRRLGRHLHLLRAPRGAALRRRLHQRSPG